MQPQNLTRVVWATGSIATDPITFCSSIFRDQINYNLVRRDPKRRGQWIPCSYGSYCQFGVVNSSVSEISVAQNEYFVCLHPGEVWERSFILDDEVWEFPDHVETGDTFRFSFKGATIDWWNWGTKDGAHAKTLVTVGEDGTNRISDNGDRPLIFVSSSNEIELYLTD
ncbi:hypothetical protein PENSTE_c040G05218 [Penicillium steckii]|uniref:Uncharacterized protein n=1 Tax=Penicillium steckii TaxID=303698 RepID=A0A1V6SJR0_9EURO|nr:hypothetical protein PENSTE_c040G05218 [Penicillium steckii]